MPSRIRVRRVFKPLVKGLAQGLNHIGLTPNLATLVMFMCSLASFFILILFENFFWFGIMVFITGIFDGIDGSIARLNNSVTKFGGFLDSVMDRLSEFIILLSLLINRWDKTLWFIIDMRFVIFVSFFASMMISYARSRAETFYKGDYDIGLMARSERLFYLFLISLISFFIGYVNELLFGFFLLTTLTAIYRAIKIYRIIKFSEKAS